MVKQLINSHLAAPGHEIKAVIPEQQLKEALIYLANELNKADSVNEPHVALLKKLMNKYRKLSPQGATEKQREKESCKNLVSLLNGTNGENRLAQNKNMFIYIWHADALTTEVNGVTTNFAKMGAPDYGSTPGKRGMFQLRLLTEGPILLYKHAYKAFRQYPVISSLNMIFGMVLIFANILRAVNVSVFSGLSILGSYFPSPPNSALLDKIKIINPTNLSKLVNGIIWPGCAFTSLCYSQTSYEFRY